jgi:hypothetical protein
LIFLFFVTTLLFMKRKRGAPRKSPETAKGKLVQIRLNESEKAAFVAAATLDGKKLSEWIRDRLRRDSRQELEEHGLPVAFLPGSGA